MQNRSQISNYLDFSGILGYQNIKDFSISFAF